MEAWRDRFRDCRQASTEAAALDGEIAHLDAEITRHRDDLQASLTVAGLALPADLSLLGLLDHAEDLAIRAATETKAVADQDRAVDDATSLVQRRESALADARTPMEQWDSGWTAAVELIGLDAAASPIEAQAVLGSLSEITTKRRALTELERRIAGIEKRNDKFTTEVGAVLANLAGHRDATDLEPGAAVKILARRLVEAQEAAGSVLGGEGKEARSIVRPCDGRERRQPSIAQLGDLGVFKREDMDPIHLLAVDANCHMSTIGGQIPQVPRRSFDSRDLHQRTV